jgi:N-acetylglutamate synthase-like GNAT family acetyltransferase
MTSDAACNEPSVRDARNDDAEVIAALLVQLGYSWPPEVIAQRLAAFHAAGERALVAERAGEVIGVITLHATPVLHRATAVGRITTLVVREDARGGGAGRALVRAAEGVLRARGCSLVEVTSNKRRTDAHAFYRRLGYDETSFRFAKQLPPHE